MRDRYQIQYTITHYTKLLQTNLPARSVDPGPAPRGSSDAGATCLGAAKRSSDSVEEMI